MKKSKNGKVKSDKTNKITDADLMKVLSHLGVPSKISEVKDIIWVREME